MARLKQRIKDACPHFWSSVEVLGTRVRRPDDWHLDSETIPGTLCSLPLQNNHAEIREKIEEIA